MTRDTGQRADTASKVDPASGEHHGSYGAEVPAEIAAIVERLHTQDNRITADPIFAVRQKRRIYGVDTDRCDNIVWVNEADDYREATPEEFAAMEAAFDSGEEDPGDWYRTGYIDKWEFVTGCLTEQGCKDYIARDGHNLNEPQIYAYGSYRNAEWKVLRKWLMSLRPEGGGVVEAASAPAGSHKHDSAASRIEQLEALLRQAREALERIGGFSMSQFANALDLANECQLIAVAAIDAMEPVKGEPL